MNRPRGHCTFYLFLLFSHSDMIDQATIDRILDAAQIVDVVSEFVTLRRRGVNYVGLCPFHNEKTPSFSVSPSKGLCKCFSCGKGGNVVHFIMEHEQLSYYEALKWLAKKYNIEIKERGTDRRREAGTQSARKLVRGQSVCRRIFSGHTLQPHRRTTHRHDVPAQPWIP